ncbi:MAG: 1-acyl-sn-glycerol-3-phosphate acyltransferase [Polyangiales bacterium]
MTRAFRVKSRFFRWLDERLGGGEPWGEDPTHYDPDAARATLATAQRWFGVGRYFDLDVRGLERVPDGPVLIVSNHSGGTTIPDVWGFLVGWYERFGVERPLHPLAHEIILSTSRTGEYFARRGVLHASSATARDALCAHRRSVMVMPGGELDTWRPYDQRWKVRFGDRRGYARVALQCGVPVVPVAHAGAHETLRVLTDGREFARKVGLKRIARAEVWPVHLSLPWGLALGPVPHLPTPTRMRYRVGRPITVPAASDPQREPAEADVLALDAATRDSVQAMLDELRRDAAHGW